jgi:hypothetical protein
VWQWVKPIGVRRKLHKYGILLGRIVNLPLQFRNKRAFLVLLGLYQAKFAKAHGGVCRMISGVGPDGTKFDEVCLRTDLEKLSKGVPMDIPDDDNGGTSEWIVEVHLLGWLADLLGAHGLGPWPESFQAHHSCRDCWWHTTCWCAYAPPDSRRAQQRRPHVNGCRHGTERGLAELQRDLQVVCGEFRTKKGRADTQRDLGLARGHCVLMNLPDSNPTTDASADIAHLFLLGITRHEIFWMLDAFIPSQFSWDDLNARSAGLALPKGHSLPVLERPTTEGKAKGAVSMNLTAVEVMHFTVNRCFVAAEPTHPHPPPPHPIDVTLAASP